MSTTKYIVAKNEKVGRLARANCDLKPGEIILDEVPFVVGPKADSQPICLGCYAPVDGSVVCSKCFWPVCSSQCETDEYHLNECQVFSFAKVKFQPVDDHTAPCPQYECITPLRFLLNIEADSKRWKNEVCHMESHDKIRKNKSIWNVNEINVVVFLREKCKLKDRFDAELIHTICGILEVNSFEARCLNGYSIRAIYPQVSILSHNCVTNTCHSVDPSDAYKISLRASVSIQKDDELFVSYTNLLWPTLYRREHLLEGKYFECDCPRCTDPTELESYTSTLKCKKCDLGFINSTNPLDSKAAWQCNNCDFKPSGETMKKMLRTMQSEIENIEGVLNKSGIEKREKLYRRYRSIFHPNHSFMTTLRYFLIQMYGRVDGYLIEDLPDLLLERKVELCEKLLEVTNIIEPGLTRIRGMILYELHAPLLFLARNHYQTEVISKEVFLKKMQSVIATLKEAAEILSLEPKCTPEGIIGQVAHQSIEHLKSSLLDFSN